MIASKRHGHQVPDERHGSPERGGEPPPFPQRTLMLVKFAAMNILALIALSLMLVAGALLFTSVLVLKICVQRFAHSHDLRFAGFIQRPYWLLFIVSLVFMVPLFVFDCLRGDSGCGESLLDLLIGSICSCGAIGLVVSFF
jgi:hypothetical protein